MGSLGWLFHFRTRLTRSNKAEALLILRGRESCIVDSGIVHLFGRTEIFSRRLAYRMPSSLLSDHWKHAACTAQPFPEIRASNASQRQLTIVRFCKSQRHFETRLSAAYRIDFATRQMALRSNTMHSQAAESLRDVAFSISPTKFGTLWLLDNSDTGARSLRKLNCGLHAPAR